MITDFTLSTTGLTAGQMLVLVIDDYTGGGDLRLLDTGTTRLTADWEPDTVGDTITLIWDGTNWNELYRSNN